MKERVTVREPRDDALNEQTDRIIPPQTNRQLSQNAANDGGGLWLCMTGRQTGYHGGGWSRFSHSLSEPN